METLICNNAIEYIIQTIDFLRKVKPTTEKIYNSIRKEVNDKLDIVEYKTNIDYLISNGIVEVRREGDQESVFIVEWTEETLEESGEKTISETNTDGTKEDGNTEIMLGNAGILYERLISNLKSEINFLKNQLLAKDTFFQDEITYLRRKLSEALTGTIAVNADEPPVIGDLVNSKPEESAMRSDSKRTNTKEESNTEMSVNSNANNDIERQRRETEKKNESASGTIRTQYNGKKDQNKSQKIVILGDSIIKNIKGWEISRKLQNANAYVRHFVGTLHERLYEAVFKRKPRSFCSSCWYR